MRRLSYLMCLLGLLSAGAGDPIGATPGSQEWERPYLPCLPDFEPRDGLGGKTVVSFRVVARTEAGKVPVPGARVAVYEACYGPTTLRPALLREVRTDEFGFANVVGALPLGQKWHVEAPGFGIVYELADFHAFDEHEIVLTKEFERPVRILDPYGRPLPGARIELLLGCPHSPAARVATTDEDGVALFGGLPGPFGDLWIMAPGVRPGPYDLPDLEDRLVGEEVPTILTEPGRTARGVVVDENGHSMPGVTIRALGFRRGPATRTDEVGRFVLHGVEDGVSLGVYAPGLPFGYRPSVLIREFDAEEPLRLTLRKDAPTALGVNEPRHVVDLLVFEASGPGVGPVPVRFTRLTDGFTLFDEQGRGAAWVVGDVEQGLVSFEVPAGVYRVTTGGGFSRFAPVSTTIEVPRPDAEPVRIRLAEEQPALGLGAAVAWRAGAILRIPAGSRLVSDERFTPWLRLPSDGPAAVLLPGGPAPVLTLGPARGGFRAPDRDPPPPNRIRMRLRGLAGEFLPAAWARLRRSGVSARPEPDGWLEFRTWLAGSEELCVRDPDRRYPEMSIPLTLPSKAGLVDLGDVVVRDPEETDEGPEERSVLVLTSDGRTLPLDRFSIWLAGPEEAGACEWRIDERAGRVSFRPIWGKQRLELDGRGWLPFDLILSSETLPELRLPGGRLSGLVRDTDGRPLSAVVYVDAHRLSTVDRRDEGAVPGTIDIRGVPSGPHLVIVGAAGHRGEVRRIVLGDGEHRRLEFSLPPR